MNSNMKIRATLDCNPGFAPMPEFYRIIRGASAYLTYNISNKSFSIDKIEQITFIFKQNRALTSYNMFDHIKLSEDEIVDDNKVYFEDVNLENHTGKEVKNPSDEDSPVENGWYELIQLEENAEPDYIIDPHFSVKTEYTTGGVFVLFYLSPEETKELKTVEMQFEIAVRLDTDNEEYLSNRDSLIIEPQQPIIVSDSLYSQIK